MSQDVRLWRFMDFYRLLDLVANGCLHLTRLDQFEDPHEGRYTVVDQRKWLAEFLEKLPGLLPDYAGPDVERVITDQIRADNVGPRKTNFVSCWFASEYDSLAMWRLYCPNNQGVAVETTLDALQQSLLEKPGITQYVGNVEYFDFDKVSIFETGRDLVLCKRPAFDFEKEVRLVVFQPFDHHRSHGDSLALFPAFLRLKVDLKVLIKAVWLPPNSPEWQVSVVDSLLQAFDLDAQIHRSELLSIIPNLPDIHEQEGGGRTDENSTCTD